MAFQKTINIKGCLIDLETPRIMGIVNTTPDSFFVSSRRQQVSEILQTAERMLKDGADFLDIGGYSSRPDAEDISEEDESGRVLGSIEALVREFPQVIISIDTFRSGVARRAVECGAGMVNDISGGDLDPGMMRVVGELGVPFIAMHMRGTPQTMKQKAHYDDLIVEITHSLSKKILQARDTSITDIIVDPGFGFAKTVEQNFFLLNNVDYLKCLDRPFLVGISRKSMIYKTLNIDAETALNGTTVLNTVALLKGASILRVHDVKEAVEVIKLIKQLTI